MSSPTQQEGINHKDMTLGRQAKEETPSCILSCHFHDFTKYLANLKANHTSQSPSNALDNKIDKNIVAYDREWETMRCSESSRHQQISVPGTSSSMRFDMTFGWWRWTHKLFSFDYSWSAKPVSDAGGPRDESRSQMSDQDKRQIEEVTE